MRPAIFWTIATIMVGLTTAALLIPLLYSRKGVADAAPNRRVAAAIALTAILPVAALAEITSHTGTQFDPQVVREFKAVLVNENLLGGTPQKTGPKGN